MDAQERTPVNEVAIRKEFQVHLLNEEGIHVAKTLAYKFSVIANWIQSVGIEGRELSIALTKLEEASFFAKKAVAINPTFQKTETTN